MAEVSFKTLGYEAMISLSKNIKFFSCFYFALFFAFLLINNFCKFNKNQER